MSSSVYSSRVVGLGECEVTEWLIVFEGNRFAAGGIATPGGSTQYLYPLGQGIITLTLWYRYSADAALMMQLGCDGVFVGSGIVSRNPIH